MALRTIVTLGNPVLHMRAQPVTTFDERLRRLVEDLWETMFDSHGAGLAAPQLGESVRVLVAKDSRTGDKVRVALVNPEIVSSSEEEQVGREGCLSIPGFVGENIRRAQEVTVSGYDVDGNRIVVEAEGWFARVLQHEVDHINGILFLNRLDKIEDLVQVQVEDAQTKDAVQSAVGSPKRRTSRSGSKSSAEHGKAKNQQQPHNQKPRPSKSANRKPAASTMSVNSKPSRKARSSSTSVQNAR